MRAFLTEAPKWVDSVVSIDLEVCDQRRDCERWVMIAAKDCLRRIWRKHSQIENA